MRDYVLNVLDPYFVQKLAELGLPPNHVCILILDCWPVHKTAVFADVVKAMKSTVKLLFVPPGCTSKFQPLDVTVQKPLKEAFMVGYDMWAQENVTRQLQAKRMAVRRRVENQLMLEEAPKLSTQGAEVIGKVTKRLQQVAEVERQASVVQVIMRWSTIKELILGWLVETHRTLSSNTGLIKSSWSAAGGLDRAMDREFQRGAAGMVNELFPRIHLDTEGTLVMLEGEEFDGDPVDELVNPTAQVGATNLQDMVNRAGMDAFDSNNESEGEFDSGKGETDSGTEADTESDESEDDDDDGLIPWPQPLNPITCKPTPQPPKKRAPILPPLAMPNRLVTEAAAIAARAMRATRSLGTVVQREPMLGPPSKRLKVATLSSDADVTISPVSPAMAISPVMMQQGVDNSSLRQQWLASTDYLEEQMTFDVWVIITAAAVNAQLQATLDANA
jgi:hypothetical protein